MTQRNFTDEDILDRLLWPMVGEGAQILAEGVALRQSNIDVVWFNGYGWPASACREPIGLATATVDRSP